MWYFIVYAAAALFVFIDAMKRQNSAGWWTLGVLLIGPVVLPVYFADRNLLAGEVRSGGRWWNILRNFVIGWTVLVAIAWFVTNLGQSDPLVIMATTFILGGIWFVGTAVALPLGVFLREPANVEHGPTFPSSLGSGLSSLTSDVEETIRIPSETITLGLGPPPDEPRTPKPRRAVWEKTQDDGSKMP